MPTISHRDGRATALLAVVSAAIFVDALDLSITQVALPDIQRSLDVSGTALPWIAAAYVVTYGGFLLLGGRLADLLGRRRIFIAGVTIFGAASAAAGLAETSGTLIVARAVQGVGAALTVPAGVALLAATFAEGERRNRAFATFAAAGSSGFAAGLVLGGALTEGLSWRWIFLAKVPVVALMLIAAMRAIVRDKTEQPATWRQMALPGAITGTAAASLLAYGLTKLGAPDPDLLDVAVPLVASALLLAVFAVVEARTALPLLPSRLLRARVAVVSDAVALCVLAAPFGVAFIATNYMQSVEGHTAWGTALVLLPGAILSAVMGRFAAGPLLSRFGVRAVYAVGLTVVAAGDAILLALSHGSAWLLAVAALISLGLGMGVTYPAATVGGVSAVHPEDQGSAAGLNNTALQIGGGLGLAIVAAAIGAHLDGAAVIAVDGERALDALRIGAAAATVIPLLGAIAVAIGLAPVLDRAEPCPSRAA
jgi:MFS family permease